MKEYKFVLGSADTEGLLWLLSGNSAYSELYDDMYKQFMSQR